MKKLLLSLTGIAVLSLTASAQNESSWGIRAGMNVTNLNFKQGNVSRSADSHLTFHVGLAYQQPLLRVLPLYVESGVYISGRGATVKENDVKMKFNMLYLQIPMLVSWHFNFKSVSVQPYAGAFYGLGIRGKAKSGEAKIDVFKSSSLNGEEIAQTFRRSEVGLRFGVGVVVKKHYYIGAGYDVGLTNISKDKEQADAGKIKNGNFFLSVGYNF